MDISIAALASLAARVATMPSLDLSSNDPVTLPPNYKCTGATSQIQSLLQIQNLSRSFEAWYFASAGDAFTKNGRIAAGATDPIQWVWNFQGAELVIANVSPLEASMKITLIG